MLARLLCALLVFALFSLTTLLAAAQSPDSGDSGVPASRLSEVVAENVAILSHWNEPSSFVLVRDSFAYVATTSTLTILDASHPFALNPLGAIPLPSEGSTVVGMAWANGHLFVRSFRCDAPGSPVCQNRVQVVDVADPAAPSEVMVFQLSVPAPFYSQKEGLAVSGNTLLVPDGQVLRVWDVSAPATIAEVSAFGYEGRAITAVAAVGSTAYATVAAASGYTLWVLDLSNPHAPDEMGHLTVPDAASARGLAVAEGRAYLVEPQRATGGGGVRVIDLSDPTAPVPLAFYPAPGDIFSVAAGANRAYIAYADGSVPFGARVQVLDVSRAAEPLPVGGFGAGQHLALSGQTLLVARGEAGLVGLREGAAMGGRVADAGGAPLPGVTISAGASLTATADANGVYTFTGVLSGTHTLTPTLEGARFTPLTRTLTVLSSAYHQDFIAVPLPVSATLEPGTATELVLTDTRGLTSSLFFPASAVNRATPIVVTPTLASNLPDLSVAGHAWEVAAYDGGTLLSGFTFAAPVTATIHYHDMDARLVADEARLMLWAEWGATWRAANQTCAAAPAPSLNTAANMLTVSLCRTGRFALFGPTYQQYLPFVAQR